jgi:hypothetical protein
LGGTTGVSGSGRGRETGNESIQRQYTWLMEELEST